MQILLLTSTIAPHASSLDLAHRDPAARLAEYLRGVEFYCQQVASGVFDRVVYVDNSGYPLQQLRALASTITNDRSYEFISYHSQQTDSGLSRFNLESILLGESFKRSETLRTAIDSDVVWKITGRYIINNIAEIVSKAPGEFDVYANFRDYPQKTIDFFVFAAKVSAWNELLAPGKDRFSRHDYGEALMRESLDNGEFGPLRVVPRFRVTPHVSGIRGRDGASYDGLSYRAKYVIRSLANRLLPGLWI